MEDRYLFKGKIKAKNTGYEELDWVTGNLVVEQSTGRHYIVDLSYFGDDTKIQDVLIEVEPSTICQCTGLEDKNGKLIWENDIVFVTDEDECTGGFDTGMGQIIFLKGLWYIDGRVQNGLYDVFDEGFNIEVIGNKFDNPELLEAQE